MAKKTTTKKIESPELKKFHGGLRRIDRALLELRTSVLAHRERYAAADKIRKAIDRQRLAARREGIDDEAALARLDALWPQVAIATDQGSTNYLADNARQSAEITARIREDRANQGGFEKELELARLRGGLR